MKDKLKKTEELDQNSVMITCVEDPIHILITIIGTVLFYLCDFPQVHWFGFTIMCVCVCVCVFNATGAEYESSG